MVKIVTVQFGIASLLLFIVLAYSSHYAAFMPLLFLNLVASIVLLLSIYLVGKAMNVPVSIAYIISFALSLAAVVGMLSWLTGDTFVSALRHMFADRKDGVAMIIPFLLSNIIVYFMVLKGRFAERS